MPVCPRCDSANVPCPNCENLDDPRLISDSGGATQAGDDPFATAVPSSDGAFAARDFQHDDRYRVIRPLAQGGLGQVFVAHDAELDREVALKEIRQRYADHPASRERFLLEARVTGILEHPGVVPIYGMGSHPDGRPFYAMRLIRGETLLDTIAAFRQRCYGAGSDAGERTLELRRLLGRFVEVCRTIDYAHDRGILHRDLKPANVMLGPHGEALVVDWGLAKVLGGDERPGAARPADGPTSVDVDGSMTQAGSSIGTPAYMSPEQARGDLDRLGPASDIYSLGAILYHILTGRSPFESRDIANLLDRVKCGDFPRPRQIDRGVPRTLQAICLKAMRLLPEDRYATARVLAADLERWMAGEPTSARRELFPRRMWRRARRRPDLAFYFAMLAAGDLFCSSRLLILFFERNDTSPLLERQAVLFFLFLVVVTAPMVTILISQFPLALGAMIGGLIGLSRGNAGRIARRGASIGAKVGLLAGLLVTIAVLVRFAPHMYGEVKQSAHWEVMASRYEAEEKKHEGTWIIESMQTDGVAIPRHQLAGLTRKVLRNSIFQFRGAESEMSSFHLDFAVEPSRYDLKPADGPDAGTTIPGIYTIEGDLLKICSARLGKDRPRAFETSPGSGLSLSVWKRVKP